MCTLGATLQISIFGFQCPCNESCRAGGRYLKGQSEETARTALFNHLNSSCYHEDLDKDSIRAMVDNMVPDEWQEDTDDYERWSNLQEEKWANRSRKRDAAHLPDETALSLHTAGLSEHRRNVDTAFPGSLHLTTDGTLPSVAAGGQKPARRGSRE